MDGKAFVNIGEQRFDRLIEEKKFYIDKTDFIREWWETGSTVTLITRPRRFGKTLNMSMVECFFSNQYADRGDLFEGLSIWQQKSPDGNYKYRKLQGIYPVIFLSFAQIKAPDYRKMAYKITKVIADLYERNSYLLDGDLLSENEKQYYKSIKPGMGEEIATDAVGSMSNFLRRRYGREKQEVKRWYDGFTFGAHTDIYNPWSIASFIRKNGKYDAYWANTSSNGLVNRLIQGGNPELKQDMERLLQGKDIQAQIDEQIAFNQLSGSADVVWSLLLATGYLKVQGLKQVGELKKKVYTLAITNGEVRSMFSDMVRGVVWRERRVCLQQLYKSPSSERLRRHE